MYTAHFFFFVTLYASAFSQHHFFASNMPRTSGPSVHALKAAIGKHNSTHCLKVTGSKRTLMSLVAKKGISVDASVKSTARKALTPEQKKKRNDRAKYLRQKKKLNAKGQLTEAQKVLKARMLSGGF